MTETAVIFGSNGAIGAAIADALAGEGGHDVIRIARRGSDIDMDLADEEALAAAAAALKGRAPSLVIVASGLLHRDGKGPEKALAQVEPDWIIENYRANALVPLLVAKHMLPVMPRQGPMRFAALSARVGSISDNNLGGWHGYRMAKAALNMAIRNLAVEWRRKNDRSIIVGLHPGTVDTPLSRPFQSNVAAAKLFDPERAGLQLLDVLDGLKPTDSGRLFAWDGAEIAP